MADNETKLAANQREITVSGEVFIFTNRYEAGHPVTENEARALNQVLSENIRNNVASKVKDEETPFGQKDFDEYATGYEFNAASVRRAKLDPVEKEAMKIAKMKVAEAIKAAGSTVKAYTESDEGKAKYAENVAKVAENPKVIDLAKKRIREAVELEDLKL